MYSSEITLSSTPIFVNINEIAHTGTHSYFLVHWMKLKALLLIYWLSATYDGFFHDPCTSFTQGKLIKTAMGTKTQIFLPQRSVLGSVCKPGIV